MRSGTPVQNQQIRELISARNTSCKNNNNYLLLASPGMRVSTRYINSTWCNRWALPLATQVLLCLCDVSYRALINSLVCWFCTGALSLVLFQIVIKVEQINIWCCTVTCCDEYWRQKKCERCQDEKHTGHISPAKSVEMTKFKIYSTQKVTY